MPSKSNQHPQLSELHSAGNPRLETSLIKPYGITELAGIYQVSVRTFKTWLDPIRDRIGPKVGRFYSIIQVEMIFAHLGMPYQIEHK